MRSLNLCFLCNKYPPEPGGLAIAVRRLAQGMAAAGHRVQLCVPDGGLPPGRVEPCLDDAIQLYRFGPHPRPEDTQATWFELVEQRHQAAALDVLHGYYIAGAGFVTVYAGRYLGVPAVISARGNDLDRAVFRPGQTGPVVWALRHAAAVTTVSQALARKAQALVPGLAAQIAAGRLSGPVRNRIGYALRLLGDLCTRGGDHALALTCHETSLRAAENPFRRRNAIEAAYRLGDRARLAHHVETLRERGQLPGDLAGLIGR